MKFGVLILSSLCAVSALADSTTNILPIGRIQGSVSARHNGHTFPSPMRDESVLIQAVVHQKTLYRNAFGEEVHGLFLQNTLANSDGNPKTSDGLFAIAGPDGVVAYKGELFVPDVGDELLVQGTVHEEYNQTVFRDLVVIDVVRKNVDLDEELEIVEANPPQEADEAARYWERREGMRCIVPDLAIVQGGRHVYTSTMDAEIWLILKDSTPHAHRNPFGRRVFRDAHPLDDVPQETFDNGNGYRILLGNHGIKHAMDDANALIVHARTFDTLAAPVKGGIYYAYGKFAIQVEQQVEFFTGVDPSLNNPPPEIDRAHAFSVATYNVRNLYDHRDDPYDECDAPDDIGCDNVSRPFNYLPDSEEAYRRHLNDLALTVMHDLHSPDVIAFQEVEDQDICEVADGILLETHHDNMDGHNDALQELAERIRELGGPSYGTAGDRDGADYRGITCPFLFREDRVEVVEVFEDHPVFGKEPQIPFRSSSRPMIHDVQNPKAFNADLPADIPNERGETVLLPRSPQIGLFRIWKTKIDDGHYEEVYVINNHFNSGPDRNVERRTAQAEYNALLLHSILKNDPEAKVIVGGDLNVYPRPDDPDRERPTDQLRPLYEAGLVNLYDLQVQLGPASAYTTVFEGQAGTLDQLFVTHGLLAQIQNSYVAHVNADWTRYEGSPEGRAASDHDPLVAVFKFAE